MHIQRKLLMNELSWVKKFTEKKTDIPVLAHALFEADGNTLTLKGTDLETGAIIPLRGEGRGKWSVTAPVDKIIQYLSKAEEDTVTLTGDMKEFNLKVELNNSAKMTIGGLAAELFPELPTPPADQVPIRLGRFASAVSRVEFAISKEESRFTLNGALIEIRKEGAVMVTTDGHRMSLAPLNANLLGEDPIRVLVRKFALGEAAAVGADCAMQFDADHIYFTWGGRMIVSRKLTGNFPEYNRVMSGDYPNHAMLPVKTLLKAVQRVSTCADERSCTTRYTIDGTGRMVVSAASVDTGSAEESLPIKMGEYDGTPFVAGYNWKYVVDFLKRTDSQTVGFCWQSDDLPSDQRLKPLKGANKSAEFVTGDGWRYIVMPMRLE